jgi:hypothetical protein
MQKQAAAQLGQVDTGFVDEVPPAVFAAKQRSVPQKMDSLVISSAPSMSMIIGTAASRVSSPSTRMRTPQPISKTPFKVPSRS